jgi:hypothetical protein
MAKPNEHLATSLRLLKAAQDQGKKVFQSTDFTRIHRQRLVANGFLSEVVKGWYAVSRPSERDGDSTAWYASFFEFVAAYCDVRFGSEWYLSPDASLALQTGDTSVPRQILIYAKQGKNNNIQLKHDTSIFDYQAKNFSTNDVIRLPSGLRVLSEVAALVQASPALFVEKPDDLQIAFARIKDISELLAKLLEGGHSTVAGRMAGALRVLGRSGDADRIIKTMKATGYVVNEQNPFIKPVTVWDRPAQSPHVMRIELMWESMRKDIVGVLPEAPGIPTNISPYVADINDRHIEDAYHSLSIEGYHVSEALIEKIANGTWDPDEDSSDTKDRDAMAAKGYHDAFEEVRKSVTRILTLEEPGKVVSHDHHDWYMKLFGPAVRAGLLEAKNLAGYRSWAIYIRNARHVPPAHEALRDLMPALFALLSKEPDPAVRAILGHFIFVYIHPYGDGNGRMGRFLMNAMLASGGYPWTVVKVQDRTRYMEALGQASFNGDIKPFAQFIAECVQKQMNKVKN